MTFRSEAEQLITARRIANLRDDAEKAEVLAFIARMRAETEAAIEASRPRIQSCLRKALEMQLDYDEERAFGWALGDGLSTHE